MLDSRSVSVGLFQPSGSSPKRSRVNVYRRVIADGHEANDGDMGTTNFRYVLIAQYLPASITPLAGDLEFLPSGQTELGPYLMICPYRVMPDGSLIVQERDIVIDSLVQTAFDANGRPTADQMYLVKNAYDPMNTKQEIHAKMQFGVINPDIASQI